MREYHSAFNLIKASTGQLITRKTYVIDVLITCHRCHSHVRGDIKSQAGNQGPRLSGIGHVLYSKAALSCPEITSSISTMSTAPAPIPCSGSNLILVNYKKINTRTFTRETQLRCVYYNLRNIYIPLQLWIKGENLDKKKCRKITF